MPTTLMEDDIDILQGDLFNLTWVSALRKQKNIV